MPTENSQILIVIVAVILVLLFFGVIFLVMVSYYNNRKLAAAREKKQLQESFEKQLLETRIEIQDQIFNSICEEIHDNVGQTLSLAKVQVNILTARGQSEQGGLNEVRETISRAINDLRDIARSLNSDRIQQQPLEELIETELDRIRKTGMLQVSFHRLGSAPAIDPRKKLISFRIVQECLQNVLKHADARKVEVSLEFDEAQMTLTLQDDGRGFNQAALENSSRGLGINNMRNRAQLMGGAVQINSEAGQGTQIKLTVPYE